MKTDIYIYIYMFDHISLNSSQNEKFFSNKAVEKMKTYLIFSNFV